VKISLCLLVWNELEGCKIDIPRLPQDVFDEVFAIDGGSTDGTVEYLQAAGIPAHRQDAPGLNAAYWQGIEMSRGDAVAFFFPKGTLPPEDLRRFRPLLESGCDLVIASRNLPGGRNEEDGRFLKPRKWLTRALGLAIALLWRREGRLLSDVLHGVRAMTVSGFRKMNPSRRGLCIDLETVVRSYRLRLARAEFPTTEVARPFGRTRFKILPTGLQFLRYLGREICRRAPLRRANANAAAPPARN
jgi:glycosyltransferase involved in cell wall biosynthesis